MFKQRSHSKPQESLRHSAEKILREESNPEARAVLDDAQEIIAELQIHRIELELQNEELRRSQVELEELHRKYFDLYDLAPVGYFILDKAGLILEANLTGARMLGVARERLARRSFRTFIHPKNRENFLRHLKQVFNRGVRQRTELLLRKKGAIRWILMESLCRRENQSEVQSLRLHTVVIDITARMEVLAALKASEQRHRLLFQSMPACAMLLKVHTRDVKREPGEVRLLAVNPAFEQVSGLSGEALENRSLAEIWPQGGAVWFEKLAEAVHFNKPVHWKGFFAPAGRYLSLTALTMPGSQVLIVAVDITERRQREMVIRQSRDDREVQVTRRTAELERAVRELKEEVHQRRAAQAALEEGSRKLREQTTRLQESNTALKVLLRQRDEDRREIEENVLHNINTLVRQHLTRLSAQHLSPRDKALLAAARTSLEEIASPLTRRLGALSHRLTPAEYRVARFISQGCINKEIAEEMGVAPSTIDDHRHNIRRKLNLTGKNINLAAFLTSLL